jgi:hypothetical protein
MNKSKDIVHEGVTLPQDKVAPNGALGYLVAAYAPDKGDANQGDTAKGSH